MWHQRSHTHWLFSGDSNTKYFHKRTSQRFHRNLISEIRDSHGTLFSVALVIQHTKGVVSADMNVSLIEDFTSLEVEAALRQMAPLKAPDPDGMPPFFFQHYWDCIGNDIVKAVLFCLNTSEIIPGLNHTFITLIPKVKSPDFISEYRPIALCNVLYKLVSKVLANILKRVLP